MKERHGDLFTTKARLIGHGVNCKGVMGAGIAKAFREKYPENYTEYREAVMCGKLIPGGYFFYPYVSPNLGILNLASQNKPGADARYHWLFSSLFRAAEDVAISGDKFKDDFGTLIAIPEIGCGIGGLQWKKVAPLIENIESLVDHQVEFEVWHYA